MEKIIVTEGEAQYPLMWHLLNGYFHRDYDIFGETLEDVVAAMNRDAPGAPLRADIQKFLRENAHLNNRQFDSQYERFFHPDVTAVGWEPEINHWRPWLERVSELLR